MGRPGIWGPAGGDTGEQDFSFIEGDFPAWASAIRGSGLPEPSEGGMALGID